MKKLFIYSTEHADLVWRRCFDRDFTFKGRNFVSYADIEGYFIKDNIEFCRKYDEFRFTVESPAMLKKFLEKNPDYEDEIKKLISEGRIKMPFAGNNIVDSNLISGEGIVRNFLYGREYLKNNFGHVPYGMDRNDAFGNTAQLPQIARKFGSKWIYHITYSTPDNLYWRGLDGSTVLVWKPKSVGYTGGYYKYPPCPACGGHRDKDCPVCGNRRIDVEFLEKMRVTLPDKLPDFDDTIPPYIYCGGEEILPSESVIKWARNHADEYDIQFIDYDDYLPYISDMIEHSDNPSESEIHSSAEINANNTGCYVTRIKTKQTLRENENLLTALEALACADALKNGGYDYEKIEGIWEKYFFTAFHDAVTATHIDAAYDEIMDTAAEIKCEAQSMANDLLKNLVKENDRVITIYNPYGSSVSKEVFVKVKTDDDIRLVDENGNETDICSYEKKDGEVTLSFWARGLKLFSTNVYTIVKTDKPFNKEETVLCRMSGLKGKPVLTDVTADEKTTVSENETVIENEFFRIIAVDNGIKEIFDKKLNTIISKQSEYMVGEWILEHDEGSPWSTLSPDMRRQALSKYTRLVKITKTDGEQRLDFLIHPGDIEGYGVMAFDINYSVSLKKNCDIVCFSSDVRWDTQNYRLRIAVPVIGETRDFYDIPYGVIERKPYKPEVVWEDNASKWASAAGDYPAINWAGVQTNSYSIAMFNKGTPSYQINSDSKGNGTIYLSVLRSPSVGSYLHSPVEYTMTDYDGMRDAGEHHFEYGIKAYAKGFDENDAVTDGIAFNSQLCTVNGYADIAPLPVSECDGARIAAVKMSQDRKGLIVRINEYHGKNGSGRLILPESINAKAVYSCDLKEDKEQQLAIDGGSVKLDIKPFEIKTLYIEL